MRLELRQKQGRTEERYWAIKLDGEKISKDWGVIRDGKHAPAGTTEDIPGPKGKKGTAAFVSGAENARFVYERDIRKKREEGYVALGEAEASNSIDHSKALPKNLCFSKPHKEINKKYKDRHDLIITRKFNGESVIVHKQSDGTVRIYSRRMDDITGYFPHLANFCSGDCIAPESILMFEGFMGKGNTRRDARLAAKIFRSDVGQALERQYGEFGWMCFYLFRVPVWAGKHVEATTTHREHIAWIQDKFTHVMSSPRNYFVNTRFLFPIEAWSSKGVDDAFNMAAKHSYEGFVAYVPEEKMGDKSYSFHGKADRPTHFFKIKPVQEDDFILYWNPDLGTKDRPLGTFGTGKHMGQVGTMSMYQVGPDGKEIYCGEVGTGLDDATRANIAKKAKTDSSLFTTVAEIHYDDRSFVSEGDKSNALQIPRIERFRGDKGPEECLFPV